MGLRVLGFGFRGLGFRAFRVLGLGFTGLLFRAFRVLGFGFRGQGLGAVEG